MASALQFPLLRDTAMLETPQILRIDRYQLPPGTEAAMRNLQKQVALAMTRWDNPHPSMAIESLTGPKEVWCLSGFQSRAEQIRAAENLETNEVLGEALGRIETSESALAELSDYRLHPAILDACLQVTLAAVPEENGDDQAALVPSKADRIRFYGGEGPVATAIRCYEGPSCVSPEARTRRSRPRSPTTK